MLGHCATWGQKEDPSGASSKEMKLGVEVRQWEAEPRNSQVGWRTHLQDGYPWCGLLHEALPAFSCLSALSSPCSLLSLKFSYLGHLFDSGACHLKKMSIYLFG